MGEVRDDAEREELPLSKAAEHLLDECRMVLPGIQALFGFQLIAVFSDGFARNLTSGEQDLHLVAIALSAVAVALIMTPAAFHRQNNPCAVTRSFIDLSTRLLLWSMVPLALSLSLDFYLIARVILDSVLAAWVGAALLAVFLSLWFVMPRFGARRVGRSLRSTN